MSFVITFTGDELARMSINDFEKYQFCLMRFEISENIYPSIILKRTFSISQYQKELEYKPRFNKFYMFQNFIKFNNSKSIYANFIELSNGIVSKNIVWMVNITKAGIVHFINEPNSYNILAVHIYRYSTNEITRSLTPIYKKLLDNDIAKIKLHSATLPADITDLILQYIDIQKLLRDYYKYPEQELQKIKRIKNN
jgi:hypothetical protein